MRKIAIVGSVALVALAAAGAALAQEGETWTTQEKVYEVTLIKIFPNAGEQYLNNLKKTWVTGVKEAIAEGLIEEYRVFGTLTEDEGYNLMLVVRHPNLASMDATDAWRAKLKAIEERVEKVISEEETEKITSTVYPEVRKIMSTKLLREIKFIE